MKLLFQQPVRTISSNKRIIILYMSAFIVLDRLSYKNELSPMYTTKRETNRTFSRWSHAQIARYTQYTLIEQDKGMKKRSIKRKWNASLEISARSMWGHTCFIPETYTGTPDMIFNGYRSNVP